MTAKKKPKNDPYKKTMPYTVEDLGSAQAWIDEVNAGDGWDRRDEEGMVESLAEAMCRNRNAS